MKTLKSILPLGMAVFCLLFIYLAPSLAADWRKQYPKITLGVITEENTEDRAKRWTPFQNYRPEPGAFVSAIRMQAHTIRRPEFGRYCRLSNRSTNGWRMENDKGKWRFTSPTHTVHAFARALAELDAEGGIARRYQRFCDNHDVLVDGMQTIGFRPLLPQRLQSPIITAFHSPDDARWSFNKFYRHLKHAGFVIYPGKVTEVDTFRIGTIGDVRSEDIHRLLEAVQHAVYW